MQLIKNSYVYLDDSVVPGSSFGLIFVFLLGCFVCFPLFVPAVVAAAVVPVVG